VNGWRSEKQGAQLPTSRQTDQGSPERGDAYDGASELRKMPRTTLSSEMFHPARLTTGAARQSAVVSRGRQEERRG
jgi:hypothetical protein